MKTYTIAIIALALTTITGLAQQPKKMDFKPGNPEMMKAMQEMQRYKTKMQLASYEEELKHENRMRELAARERELELERMEKEIHGAGGEEDAQWRQDMKECHDAVLLLALLINLLMAIWVYRDIRKRNSGSGIWIVITLLAGFFGIVPYAIIRLGDEKQ